MGLTDVSQDLFIHKNNGVLTQEVGPRKRPVTYISKQIDSVAAGWPPCLRALVATTLLIKETDNLNVKVSHSKITLRDTREHHWLTHAWMTQYQVLLCENP